MVDANHRDLQTTIHVACSLRHWLTVGANPLHLGVHWTFVTALEDHFVALFDRLLVRIGFQI